MSHRFVRLTHGRHVAWPPAPCPPSRMHGVPTATQCSDGLRKGKRGKKGKGLEAVEGGEMLCKKDWRPDGVGRDGRGERHMKKG